RRGLAAADRRAVIVDAVGDDGPAIVLAGFGDVDLVAAARPVLAEPRRAGLRVERGALDVAVAVGPDLRQRALGAHERVVLRHGAVAVDPDDLAEMGIEILRLAAEAGLGALAGGDEEVALVVEDEPRPVMLR